MSSESRDGVSHEWVSFEHDGGTWLFDVTFLTSNWSCIWNEGCLGIRTEPTPEAAQGCCSFGAHFSDEADLRRTRAAAKALSTDDWQLRRPLSKAFVKDDEGQWSTALVDDACVFLNRPGFDGGHGCALHRHGDQHGLSVREVKPEVCWQLPLRLEHHEDENGHPVATVRQWQRHDWGDGGDQFHWWCTDDPLAFIEHTPVFERLQDELVGLVGAALTERLTDYLRHRRAESLLPHPAVRRSR